MAKGGRVKDVEVVGRGQRKKQKILDAAAKVISLRGYSGTMLSEIARQANTHAGALYYHFASREELIEEVLQHGVHLSFNETRKKVDSLLPSASARDRLEAAIRAHLESMLIKGSYARATARLLGQVPEAIWNRASAINRSYGKYFDQLIKDAMDAGEIDTKVDRSAFRLFVFGAANWAPEWFNPKGRLDANSVADLLIRVIMNGVATGRVARGKPKAR